jgi:hypothetical protein
MHSKINSSLQQDTGCTAWKKSPKAPHAISTSSALRALNMNKPWTNKIYIRPKIFADLYILLSLIIFYCSYKSTVRRLATEITIIRLHSRTTAETISKLADHNYSTMWQ